MTEREKTLRRHRDDLHRARMVAIVIEETIKAFREIEASHGPCPPPNSKGIYPVRKS